MGNGKSQWFQKQVSWPRWVWGGEETEKLLKIYKRTHKTISLGLFCLEASNSYPRGITMKPYQLRVLWSSEMNIIGVSRPGLPLPHWWPLLKSVHRNILFGWYSVFFVSNVIATIFKWVWLHKIWILNFSWRMGRSLHSGPAFKQGSKLLELSKWLPICLWFTTAPTSPLCLFT